MSLPDKYDPGTIEPKWQTFWDESPIYQFDPDGLGSVFSIDTPPPTVSGSLHVGHVFSYTHTDLSARFWRMRGRNVLYPMGWDDNGLPTERRVQELHGVRCDPRLSGATQSAPKRGAKQITAVDRTTFLDLCARVAAEDEKAFEAQWRRLGLSVDWHLRYATSNAHCRRLSQRAFLDLVRRGDAYSADAPTMWDIDFETAIAQAETEDREIGGLECQLRFGLEGGGTLPIMTTRPELLAACVAVIVHPDDERHRSLIGRTAVTPGYRVAVPIFAHPLADPNKGTGAVMVCTFGDTTDVAWWQELGLATRMILGRDGRILPLEWGPSPWDSPDPAGAQQMHNQIASRSARQAKLRIMELLRDPAAAADGTGLAPLEGEPRSIRQTARFYEKGDRPLEIQLARQWFIRLLDKKEALLRQGRKIRWRPAHMGKRYERWVEGLKYDWCVSRQRFHGVPLPVWYALGGDGQRDYESPILPADAQSPIDPACDTPPGYDASQRDQPGGFAADTDVLDTWATSSLTPRIVLDLAGQGADAAKLYPMDMRPQAHDIIRTWAFYTIARAYLADGSIPWREAVISGWVLDPDRKKMSKSKGNVVTPMALFDQHGADAVRYWSASARLGTDTSYDESVFRTGRRLATKVFNAGKLIVGRLDAAGVKAGDLAAADAIAPLDRAHLSLLAEVTRSATELMECFETAAALEAIEAWFWSNLCDNYLELTKRRAYAGDRSALAAWEVSLSAALRMFAPFLPYITEEVWSWRWGADGSSIHVERWPTPGEIGDYDGDLAVFEAAVAVLSAIRRHKTEAKISLRTPLTEIEITGPAAALSKLELALGDVLAAGAVEAATLRPGDGQQIAVHFGSPP